MTSDKMHDFEQWLEAARSEAVPKVDVAERVLRSIQSIERYSADDVVARRFLAGCLTIAVLSIAFFLLTPDQEVPVEILQPFVTELP